MIIALNRETHYHGFLPSLRHPAVVDKDYQPELDKPLTEKGHVFSNSDQKDQVLCMPSNNTTKGENKDTNYKKKNNPLSREKSSVARFEISYRIGVSTISRYGTERYTARYTE